MVICFSHAPQGETAQNFPGVVTTIVLRTVLMCAQSSKIGNIDQQIATNSKDA
jgi:hypothetical protein